MKDMADELFKLYATRKAAQGHIYPPDSQWQKEFEDSFEFNETDDQLTAIADIKRDMESPPAHGPASLWRRWLRQN